MKTTVEYVHFGFSIDLAGEEIDALGLDLATLTAIESPLGTVEDIWDDEEIRDQFPDAIDQIGEFECPIVLGRLTSLFGVVTLDEGEVEGMGFRAPLIVTRAGDDEPIAVAVAHDDMGASRLAVTSFDENEETALEIAREFWGLILGDLDEIEEEDVRVFNTEERQWLCYGITDGEPFMYMEDAAEEELDEYEDDPYGQDQYENDEVEEEY